MKNFKLPFSHENYDRKMLIFNSFLLTMQRLRESSTHYISYVAQKKHASAMFLLLTSSFYSNANSVFLDEILNSYPGNKNNIIVESRFSEDGLKNITKYKSKATGKTLLETHKEYDNEKIKVSRFDNEGNLLDVKEILFESDNNGKIKQTVIEMDSNGKKLAQKDTISYMSEGKVDVINYTPDSRELLSREVRKYEKNNKVNVMKIEERKVIPRRKIMESYKITSDNSLEVTKIIDDKEKYTELREYGPDSKVRITTTRPDGRQSVENRPYTPVEWLYTTNKNIEEQLDEVKTTANHHAKNGEKSINANFYQENTLMKQLNSEISEIGKNVFQDTDGVIHIGQNLDGMAISVSGQQGDRTITGVAEGVKSNDAANIAQLNSVRSTATSAHGLAQKNSSRINNLENQLSQTNKKIDRGLASSAALTGLFQPYGVGNINFTAGMGTYGSSVAMAVGSGYRVNEHVAVKAGLAYSGGNNVTSNASFNLEW